MPVIINKKLPAYDKLLSENIFVMSESRAVTQDIRPLKILILNLMPKKIDTETQLLRMIGNTPLQVNVDFIKTNSYESKNTSKEHLDTFYYTFDEIKNKTYDGCIITGAPVEQMPFESVNYWEELKNIFAFTRTNVQSTLFICWASQAALYHFYGIDKEQLPKKSFGVFEHFRTKENYKILRGFDDAFYAPHSRHTTSITEAIKTCPHVEILAESPKAGPYLIISKDQRQIFVTGHSEYDDLTLASEYFRDFEEGLHPNVPENYFVEDNPNNAILNRWKSHGNLLFSNWLNYYVYQETPYDLTLLHFEDDE